MNKDTQRKLESVSSKRKLEISEAATWGVL